LFGIVIVAENAPVEDVVTLAGVVASVVESNFTVMALFAVNPVPVIVTVMLGAPEFGDNVIVGVKDTVNVADAVFVPSVADTVWLPVVVPAGIAKLALNVPDELVVIVEGFVVTVLLSNFIVICLFAPKPEPNTVIVVPAAPEVGDNVIAAPTLKVADTVLVPSVTVMV